MDGELKKEAVVIAHGKIGKEDALEKIIQLVCSVYKLTCCDEIFNSVFARESKLSTGIGLGIAVPHCRVEHVDRIVTGALLIPQGIDYNSVDNQPGKLIFLIVSPLTDIQGHIVCLSSVAHAVSDEDIRRKLFNAKHTDELYHLLKENLGHVF